MDGDKQWKLVSRIMNYLEFTNPKILFKEDEPNLRALTIIYCWLAHQDFINKPDFIRKLEGYLIKEIEKKDFRLESMWCVNLIHAFGR